MRAGSVARVAAAAAVAPGEAARDFRFKFARGGSRAGWNRGHRAARNTRSENLRRRPSPPLRAANPNPNSRAPRGSQAMPAAKAENRAEEIHCDSYRIAFAGTGWRRGSDPLRPTTGRFRYG